MAYINKANDNDNEKHFYAYLNICPTYKKASSLIFV